MGDESQRAAGLALIVEKAVALFEGDTQAAARWLNSPNRAFDGQAPLAVARSEAGTRQVEQLIGRLEHGVFT